MPKRTFTYYKWSIINAINTGIDVDFSELEHFKDTDFNGWYLIHWSAMSGNEPVIRKLINAGYATLDTEAPMPYCPLYRTPRTILNEFNPSLLKKIII
jgi:hypothetical protein